ncbi:MAG: helix-turn-helix domain-containing protein [Acutalibacteraceae bacterium]
MSVDYKLIGSRIKEKRKGLKMTQEMLSEKLGVTVGYISQLERGITKISLSTLADISEILCCDMSFFVSGAALNQPDYLQKELVEKYSLLTQKQKRCVLGFIDIMIKNSF